MVVLDLNCEIYFPIDSLFIPYGDNFIVFSNTNFTFVLVDQKGKDLLQSCSGKLTFLETCQIQSKLSTSSLEKSLVQVNSFVQQLLDSRFVSLNEPSESTRLSNLPQTGKASRFCYIDLTNHCNLNCIYCYNADERRRNMASSAKELTDDEIAGLLIKLKENGFECIVFTGGEPLLRKNIFQLAKLVQNLGMQAALLTNGTLITQGIAKKIATSFNSIIVSLDSCVKEEHELQRGKGTFVRILKGLEYLATAGRVEISVRSVITKNNIDNLYKLPSFVHDRFNCRNLQPTFYLPNSLTEMICLQLLPDLEIYRVGMSRFSDALREVPGVTDKDHEPPILAGKCGAGKSIFSISNVGDLYPCQALHFDRFLLGNIRIHRFEDIFSGNNPKSNLIPTVFDVPVCQSCNLAVICGGGCRAAAYSLYSDLFAHNKALCGYFRTDACNSLVKEFLCQTDGNIH
ncbi:MAG: radical SAM protein [Dehalococcoidia bacterium]|nr:radical SAM protein [Dehalococcoidia bacterium]